MDTEKSRIRLKFGLRVHSILQVRMSLIDLPYVSIVIHLINQSINLSTYILTIYRSYRSTYHSFILLSLSNKIVRHSLTVINLFMTLY